MEAAKNSVEVYLCIVLVGFDELIGLKENIMHDLFEHVRHQNLEDRMKLFKVALGVFQPA